MGSDSIMKILDRDFVASELLRIVGRYCSWVAYPYISNHTLVMLQLVGSSQRKNYPFKLKSQWLYEADFS